MLGDVALVFIGDRWCGLSSDDDLPAKVNVPPCLWPALTCLLRYAPIEDEV